MDCKIHFGVEAITKCSRCGAGICKECYEITGKSSLCPACVVESSEEKIKNALGFVILDKSLMVLDIIVTFGLLAVIGYLTYLYSNYFILFAIAPIIVACPILYVYIRRKMKKRKKRFSFYRDRLEKCKQLVNYQNPV